MWPLADDIASLPELHQLCMALCVVERVLVTKSLLDDTDESSFTNSLTPVIDELWDIVINDAELPADTYERLRQQTNECRPATENDNPEFRLRDICWILKTVLKVFRGKEDAFEIARLGAVIASVSFLHAHTEMQNQEELLAEVTAISHFDESTAVKLRESLRSLPVAVGDIERDHRD